jgi:hypothetical protein
METSSLISFLHGWIQNNTGNVYEIAVGLTLVRQMGITQDTLAAALPVLETIAITNTKKTEEIRLLVRRLQDTPNGNGVWIDGKRIVNLLNATQEDGVGTGDIVLVLDDSTKKTVSITEGKPDRNGKLQKCVTNPSAKRFGCTNEDITWIKSVNNDAVAAYKTYMSETYGHVEETWPSRIHTNISDDACNKVANRTATRFQSLPVHERIRIVNSLLWLDKPQADYFVMVDKKTYTSKWFAFGEAKVSLTDPRLNVDGIYLYTNIGDAVLSKTQVKFNNGIYHKGKESGLHSSWNVVCFCDDLFHMRPVILTTVSPPT